METSFSRNSCKLQSKFLVMILERSNPFMLFSVPGGRLECTMQNIADNFFNTFSSRCFKDVEGIWLFIFLVILTLSFSFMSNVLYALLTLLTCSSR